MSQPTASEAAQTFWDHFKVERHAIEEQIQSSAALPKETLAVHFTATLQRINDLEKQLTKATNFIPSYDERQLSLHGKQLKSLNEALNTTKIQLTPKPKFSFKSRKKKTESSTSTQTFTVGKADLAADVLDEATVSFRDMSDQVLIPSGSDMEKPVDVLLSNLTRCVVYLCDKINISALHVRNVSNCVVVCGSIGGSVLMYGFTRSVLSVTCHQFRMHEAQNATILLRVSSRPIMEDSAEVQIGCLPSTAGEIFANLYNEMEDFNWLKKQASPNWSLLSDIDADKLYKGTEMIARRLEQGWDHKDLLGEGMQLLPKTNVIV
ncbi:hypothetical protein DFQ30_003736 [Apophysomyces sp. BC1015]|nr:hypothetical protein DFQ30_003736 [Apophysomyces sp. BC1015]